MSDSKKEKDTKTTDNAASKEQNGSANATDAKSATNNKSELGLLEEDDEFEEFETEDWQQDDKDVNEEDKDTNLWEDNWDDDNVEDDFTVQLRAELEKRGQKLELP